MSAGAGQSVKPEAASPQRAELLTPLPAGLLNNLRCKCGNENCANIDAVKEHIAALTQRVEAAESLLSRANALLANAIPLAGPANEYGSWDRWHNLKDALLPESAAALSQEPRDG